MTLIDSTKDVPKYNILSYTMFAMAGVAAFSQSGAEVQGGTCHLPVKLGIQNGCPQQKLPKCCFS